ncbi:Hemin import ATP-binding protein HmuV [Corynebacterium lowii]|uniref:Hemin import ATP-binding protein HmuV n=2 Tax=Corynebacterium lowii TaxID=1544413 RepID=A0A0Q0Z8G0_9CORY|nr:Hemin import ATP-binding protein HmuV [Corynebacterium lowii]
MGVDPHRLRCILFLLTALDTGALVAVNSTISFVGLVIPHLTRMVLGSGHHRLTVVAPLVGALLMVWANLLPSPHRDTTAGATSGSGNGARGRPGVPATHPPPRLRLRGLPVTPALHLRQLAVETGGRRVVGPMDLDLPTGTVTAIVGPNGCGESTLLFVLYRARHPASGTAEVLGRYLSTLSLRESARLIAALHQEEHPELDFTVAEIASIQPLTPALRLAGVEHIADRGVLGLSGSERQRTLIRPDAGAEHPGASAGRAD